MAEDARAVAGEMPVKGNVVANVAQELAEPRLAELNRVQAQVLAIELDEIECAQQCIMMIAKPIAQGIEYREAALVTYDDLAVERA